MKKDIQAAILRAAGRFIEKRLGPIEPRLKALEDRPILKGDPGRDGENGKDAAPVDVAEIVGEVLKQIPVPKDGRDAPTVDEIVSSVAARIDSHLAAIPPPKDGEKGDAGTNGIDGKSITLDDVLPVLKSMQAEWALDFERRAQALFQKAVEAIPKPKDGRDGLDGIGWDDMVVEHDGKRTVTLKWLKGEVEHSADIVIPCVIDAGFYKDGMRVEKGDGVTFGGSYWIAQKATSAKPGVGIEDWRLACRKGRDGKNAR